MASRRGGGGGVEGHGRGRALEDGWTPGRPGATWWLDTEMGWMSLALAAAGRAAADCGSPPTAAITKCLVGPRQVTDSEPNIGPRIPRPHFAEVPAIWVTLSMGAVRRRSSGPCRRCCSSRACGPARPGRRRAAAARASAAGGRRRLLGRRRVVLRGQRVGLGEPVRRADRVRVLRGVLGLPGDPQLALPAEGAGAGRGACGGRRRRRLRMIRTSPPTSWRRTRAGCSWRARRRGTGGTCPACRRWSATT